MPVLGAVLAKVLFINSLRDDRRWVSGLLRIGVHILRISTILF